MKKTVTLDVGQSKSVTFNYNPIEPKIYSVNIDGLFGSFTAVEAVSLYGIVSDANTGNPIGNGAIIFNSDIIYTDATGQYAITNLKVGALAITFSYEGYEAYHAEITLGHGNNRFDAALTPTVTGELTLSAGWNLVTYTGKSQTVNDAFASIAEYVAGVLHSIDSATEYICSSPIGITKLMIPGDKYWIAVIQDSLWRF